MNTKIWIVIGFIILLYYLKAPSVVIFVNGILSVITTVWNDTLDILMNLKERHPWVWMSLLVWLFFLMGHKNAES